jgi:hypothetical protein
MMNFFKMNLFLAAFPAELCNIIAQQDQTNKMLKTMYKIVTTSQRGSNSLRRITAMADEFRDRIRGNRSSHLSKMPKQLTRCQAKNKPELTKATKAA